MPKQVLGLRLFTNRGRSLIARALHSDTTDKGLVTRDGVIYEEVKVQYMDMPFNSGTIKGFFGRSDDSGDGKIYRLGVIWCRLDDLKPEEAEADFTTAEDVVDLDDLALLQKDQTTGNKALEAIQQRLENTEQVTHLSRNSRSTTDIISNLRKAAPQSSHQKTSSPRHDKISQPETARLQNWRDSANQFGKLNLVLSPPRTKVGQGAKTLGIIVPSHSPKVILHLQSFCSV